MKKAYISKRPVLVIRFRFCSNYFSQSHNLFGSYLWNSFLSLLCNCEGFVGEKDGIKMMHKIKKATSTIKGTENAEFADYRNRLDNLASYLRESSAALNESERAWREVCNRQKVFAEKFANRYPDKDEVREFGKQSASLSDTLVREFVLKTEGSNADHWKVDNVVTDYLGEIADIASEYKPVADAMKEVSMYSKKVDDLQIAKKTDEQKLQRNLEKLDEAKKAYESILDRVVERMKAVYNKRQVALKATYVAYWSSQLRAFDLVDKSLDPTREFVESSVESFFGLNIKGMSQDDVAKFVERNGSVPPVKMRESPAPSPSSAHSSLAASPAASPSSLATQTQDEAPKVVPVSPVEASEDKVPEDPPVAAI